MKTQISLLTIAAALIAVPVVAAPGGKTMGDADGNGVITRAEVQTAAQTRFAKMDVNSDGQLDAADRAAKMAERQDKRFATLDADGNGSITRTEWDAQAQQRQAKRAERGGEAGAPGKRGGRHGMRGAGKRGGPQAMMMRADANGDKAITPTEFQTAMLAQFDRADVNKDGQVTAEERRAGWEAKRAEWRAKRAAPAAE